MAERTSLTLYRNSDVRITYSLPDGYNLTGYAPVFYFRTAEGESPVLTVSGSATANGSLALIEGGGVVLTVKAEDAALFPGGDISTGVYDSTLTKDNFVNRFVGGPVTVYVDGSYGKGLFQDALIIDLGGQDISVIIEGGNLAVGASVALSELNTAVAEAGDSAEAAEISAAQAASAVAGVPVMIAGKVDLTALAASGGSALVGTIGAGAESVLRTQQSKNRDVVSFKDFATGAGVADDQPQLQALVTGFGILGGSALVPQGTYRTSASIDIFDPVSFRGFGSAYTAINPSLATSGSNSITVAPTALADHSLQTIEGITIGDASTGTRVGLNGILLLTDATGESLPKFTIRDVNIGAGSGPAIGHVHTSPDPQGGLYGGLIENSLLRGGIRLDGSGDSNCIRNNIIAGTLIGVHANLIAGASLLEIIGNNITNAGGAIRITDGMRTRIIGNNIENSVAGALAQNDGAVVTIDPATSPHVGGVVTENLISAFGATTATRLLKIEDCRGLLIENNVFLSGAAGVTTAIEIGSGCQDIRVGRNTFSPTLTTQVLDNGIGTMGVPKPLPTLQNGWTGYAPAQYANATYIRCPVTGDVILYGHIKSGTAAAGTLIFTFPVGMRPADIERLQVYSTLGADAVDVYPDGTVLTVNVASAIIGFNGARFPTAGFGNAVSPE